MLYGGTLNWVSSSSRDTRPLPRHANSREAVSGKANPVYDWHSEPNMTNYTMYCARMRCEHKWTSKATGSETYPQIGCRKHTILKVSCSNPNSNKQRANVAQSTAGEQHSAQAAAQWDRLHWAPVRSFTLSSSESDCKQHSNLSWATLRLHQQHCLSQTQYVCITLPTANNTVVPIRDCACHWCAVTTQIQIQTNSRWMQRPLMACSKLHAHSAHRLL